MVSVSFDLNKVDLSKMPPWFPGQPKCNSNFNRWLREQIWPEVCKLAEKVNKDPNAWAQKLEDELTAYMSKWQSYNLFRTKYYSDDFIRIVSNKPDLDLDEKIKGYPLDITYRRYLDSLCCFSISIFPKEDFYKANNLIEEYS